MEITYVNQKEFYLGQPEDLHRKDIHKYRERENKSVVICIS